MGWQIYLFITLVGGVVLTIGDQFHILTGVLAYPLERYPFYLGPQPYWVFLIMSAAALSVTGLYHFMWKRGFEDLNPERVTRWNGFWAFAIFATAYIGSGYLANAGKGIADGVLAFVCFLLLFLRRGGAGFWIFVVLVSIAGTAVEMTLVKLGYFNYLPGRDQFLGVPMWLPWLYLLAAHGADRLIPRLVAIEKNLKTS